MPMRWHAGWRPPNAARGTGTGDDRISAKFISFPLASLAPPMRRSVCQRQNLLRFLLRKVFVFFRPARQPARLPSALLVDLRSGAHWGSSWFWVLLSLRRSHRWTQALNRSHPNSAFCFASHPIFNLSEDCYAARVSLAWLRSGSYTFPVTHSRCNSTASFLATATTALFFAFLPPRSHNFNPHRRKSVSGPNGPII